MKAVNLKTEYLKILLVLILKALAYFGTARVEKSRQHTGLLLIIGTAVRLNQALCMPSIQRK